MAARWTILSSRVGSPSGLCFPSSLSIQIRFTGGAARSRVWAQIFADVLGVPVDIPEGTELGALGEFIGSITIIATLIYLAVQIRQNSKTVRISMVQGRVGRAHRIGLAHPDPRSASVDPDSLYVL